MSRLIVPSKKIIKPFHIQMEGYFRLQCINKFSGKVTQDTKWFPNTILNNGRNAMATEANWLTWCQVGTDGSFPATLPERQAETTLGNWFAGTNSIVADSNGQSGVAPHYGWRRKTWRFPAGTFNGGVNLSEAGAGWGVGGAGQPDALISRAAILDPVLQTPTTVTPLGDELLDVSYELRYYSPVADVAGPSVFLLDTTYDTLTRAANVTGGSWSQSIGTMIGYYRFDDDSWYAADGAIGTVENGPSGVSAGSVGANFSNGTYSLNSYERLINISVGTLGWNLVSGIRSIRVSTTAGNYQTQFTANPGGTTIPKTVDHQMSMDWTISWAEKV